MRRALRVRALGLSLEPKEGFRRSVLCGLPLWRRKRWLEKITNATAIGCLFDSADPALLERTLAADLEGVVAKRRSDPYAQDAVWVKVKHWDPQNEGRWELFRRR